MELVLIFAAVIISVLIFIVSFYLLALYCHPEDKEFGASLICKIVVIAGIFLCCAQIMLFPLDIAQQWDKSGDLSSLWNILFMATALMVLIIIPWTLYFYESDDDLTMFKRILNSLIQLIFTLIFVACAIFISYAYFQEINVPYTQYSKLTDELESSLNLLVLQEQKQQTAVQASLKMNASIPLYILSFLSFIGWIFFLIFGGVGLASLPLDLLAQFKNRPIQRSSAEMIVKRQEIKNKVIELSKLGDEIKESEEEIKLSSGYFNRRKKKSELKAKYGQWQAEVYDLEKEHEIFKCELNFQEFNPASYFGKFIMGIVFLITSIIWLIHIILYMGVRPNGFVTYPFLNSFLADLDKNGYGPLSSIILGWMSLYLLGATVKGNFKVGVQIPFLFTIHPMVPNETYMNSFLFNLLIVLLCSTSIIQFSQNAFSDYARNTSLNLIFDSQVKYMSFYKYFYENNVFEYSLLAISLLTFLQILLRASHNPMYQKLKEKGLK